MKRSVKVVAIAAVLAIVAGASVFAADVIYQVPVSSPILTYLASKGVDVSKIDTATGTAPAAVDKQILALNDSSRTLDELANGALSAAYNEGHPFVTIRIGTLVYTMGPNSDF